MYIQLSTYYSNTEEHVEILLVKQTLMVGEIKVKNIFIISVNKA